MEDVGKAFFIPKEGSSEPILGPPGQSKLISRIKVLNLEVPVVAQCLTNPTSNHEVVGLVPCLSQWAKDPALL